MRCKACNAQLKASEGRWNPVTKEHDELCRKCKGHLTSGEESKDDLPLTLPTPIPKA
jgi:predicted SprT family Zn-dependent metalloprotease